MPPLYRTMGAMEGNGRRRVLVGPDDVRFKAVRSSGPGGQRVNRRSTKVQLWVRIGNLRLSDQERRLIRARLEHRINHRDELEVAWEGERLQERNRALALEHLNELLAAALRVPPRRIPTEPHRGAREARLSDKRFRGVKKERRRASR